MECFAGPRTPAKTGPSHGTRLRRCGLSVCAISHRSVLSRLATYDDSVSGYVGVIYRSDLQHLPLHQTLAAADSWIIDVTSRHGIKTATASIL